MTAEPSETLLRELIPSVLGVLVRRGADFATAEDAVQEALVAALGSWASGASEATGETVGASEATGETVGASVATGETVGASVATGEISDPPRDPKGWLVTVAWRKFLDLRRSDTARRGREERLLAEPAQGPTETWDDTLELYFLCAHPSLTSSSAVALTLRAVGGLTTRQIAAAYLVPEPTMAQRISRAKRAVADVRFDAPGDLAAVLTTLYLVFNEGYSGDVDLAAEAIRLTRRLVDVAGEAPEVCGLLALMLLYHARRDARTRADGSLIPLAAQDRTRWNGALIAEGVDLLQAALARDSLGPYQAQAAIAALHADARTVEETDWVQIVEWYDELLALTDSTVVRLNRAVAVGQADGARAGLAALADVDPAVPRYKAAAAYLHEQDGDINTAARLYVEAAAAAPNLAERDHLTREAARLRYGG